MVDAEPLHLRLLHLRQKHFYPAMTQPEMGLILGVKAPTISSWERGDAVPPVERIAAYATLFASHRSVDLGELLAQDELTETERTTRAALLDELLGLRERAVSGTDPVADDLLTFRDATTIRIICGKVDEPPKTARGHRWNYMALSAYADLDSLVQLHGHLRARNPESDVRYKLAGRIEGHDLRAHLLVLGNLAMVQTDLRPLMPDLPWHQVSDAERAPDGELFEIHETGERFAPLFAGDGAERRVVGDYGLIARMPSPVDPARTLTVLSGIYTRGVYGAVRCLTDRELGPANARWLARRFAATPVWTVLMHVRGTDHAIGTPRLSEPGVVAYAHPAA